MLSTTLDSHVPGEEFCLSFHTRNHTRPDISLGPVFFSFLLSKIRFMSSFVKKFGTRDHRNLGLTGSVWFFVCDLW